MELHHGYDPWTSTSDTKNLFGHADWDVAKKQGKSAKEIADWARANTHLMGRGADSKVYKDIMAAEKAASGASYRTGTGSSSGSFYTPGSGGASLISGGSQMELPEFMNVETGKSSTNRESQVDVWNPEDFEGGSFSNSFNTDIKQNAQVDNSFTNNFGDNNVFGAGSNIGNQNSTTMINQNAEGARIAMNGGYANPYGEAKERGQNRIKFSNAMLAG